MSRLSDGFGRRFYYLRLSVVEACNFKCSYCLPHGYVRAHGRPPELERDEIRRLVSAFASLGLRKVRITGGEPSVRRDLEHIIGDVAATPDVERVALTTNGYRLLDRIDGWQRAGLGALNVSVDSLRPDRFAGITGHDRLPSILAGIDRAIALQVEAVKLNAVLLRDVNDDELPGWLEYIRWRPVSVRFIELMRTGDNADYFARHHRRVHELADALCAEGWTEAPRRADAGPARELTHPEFAGRIGFIAPYAADFCGGCNRLRVTSGGDLRLCLFGSAGFPLRPLLQRDEQRQELVDTVRDRLQLKEAGHRLHEGITGITPHLASIGG